MNVYPIRQEYELSSPLKQIGSDVEEGMLHVRKAGEILGYPEGSGPEEWAVIDAERAEKDALDAMDRLFELKQFGRMERVLRKFEQKWRRA